MSTSSLNSTRICSNSRCLQLYLNKPINSLNDGPAKAKVSRVIFSSQTKKGGCKTLSLVFSFLANLKPAHLSDNLHLGMPG